MSECLRNEYSAATEILGDRSKANRIGDVCSGALTLIEGRGERSPLRSQWVCRAGCAFCCVARIDVYAPQAIEIAEYVRLQLPSARLEELRSRLSERVRQFSKMTIGEQAVAGLPCLFLQENNTCLVHPVRPAVCAAFSSCSAQRCQEASANPSDASKTIPYDIVQAAVGEGVMAGLGLACAERGLDHWIYELHSAVLRALDTPDAGEKWLAGDMLFRSCLSKGAEANSTIEQIRETKAASTKAPGRNSPCPCGSGKKYKKCCMLRG